ncbi:F0F1 ATP synthase subunit alpha [Hahella sp. CCB-MM4]|uniref:F0F1 ATP synthase subunit alpha n=1 Tax=Hahella sp. (strain CCB-MM4) TaxID=1926491 RepID=UPI000B9AC3BA|nr:F0F1 ATP synthase subunit alpha [Hahella sp. CCB-MM4]OZG70104.1 F0F1 ATP synthase subunit alpha [Hahella sp. CCB-MM4]
MDDLTTLLPEPPLKRVKEWLAGYRPEIRIQERGRLISVGDGVAWIKGLPSARIEELLNFEDGSLGMVFDLCEDQVGAIILKQTGALVAGQEVHRTRRPLGFLASDSLLGWVIDPSGQPLDGRAPLTEGAWLNLNTPTPSIVERDTVHEPLYTGIRMIDAMIPIGRGQRQLIIGDEGLGRTSIALNTVLNQKGRNVRCIYVLIGQKRSAAVNIMQVLKRHNADEYTTLMVADAGSTPGLQYLAPFAGSALASHWMRQGHHVLVVYDDLSSHARSYRELSLLLRRPPGREAYPGDVFSIHARLLEQATCLSPAEGGGSLTALPIAETQQGEIAAYIPTNLISITDGQIYLDRNLFAAGIRPAIDVGRSVSRIGGKAQHSAIKQEAGRMKLDYSRFLELEIFTRFGAKLDPAMQAIIHRGQLLRELLKQDRFERVSPEHELAWMIAFNEGLFDERPLDKVQEIFERMKRAGLSLTLDSPRGTWVKALESLFATASELATASNTREPPSHG